MCYVGVDVKTIVTWTLNDMSMRAELFLHKWTLFWTDPPSHLLCTLHTLVASLWSVFCVHLLCLSHCYSPAPSFSLICMAIGKTKTQITEFSNGDERELKSSYVDPRPLCDQGLVKLKRNSLPRSFRRVIASRYNWWVSGQRSHQLPIHATPWSLGFQSTPPTFSYLFIDVACSNPLFYSVIFRIIDNQPT